MNLKSFGCSFIYGSELPDSTVGPSQLTWPAKLAKHVGADYNCYAIPGSGNLQIAEQVLNQLATNEQAFYVIGWTWIDRFDYADSASNRWHTIMPVDKTDIAKIYYKDLHSQYRDKLTTLIYIRLVIDTLKQKGYPFIMTYMDELVFETEWHTTPAVVELQEYIQPHMTQFEGKTFLNWSRVNGYPETDLWHPLEQAHVAGGDYMKSNKFVSKIIADSQTLFQAAR